MSPVSLGGPPPLSFQLSPTRDNPLRHQITTNETPLRTFRLTMMTARLAKSNDKKQVKSVCIPPSQLRGSQDHGQVYRKQTAHGQRAFSDLRSDEGIAKWKRDSTHLLCTLRKRQDPLDAPASKVACQYQCWYPHGAPSFDSMLHLIDLIQSYQQVELRPALTECTI
jgi:hypothetical protein